MREKMSELVCLFVHRMVGGIRLCKLRRWWIDVWVFVGPDPTMTFNTCYVHTRNDPAACLPVRMTDMLRS